MMIFTGETASLGVLVDATPEGWRVRLDDGREVVARIGDTEGLYKFVPGEKVCVSFHPSREPVLTGYLE